MSVLSPEQMQKLAYLARLEFRGEELERINEQLNRILEYVSQLQELDLSDVPPMAHVQALFNVTRPDQPEPSGIRDFVLHHAPDRDGPFFRVPQFVGEE